MRSGSGREQGRRGNRFDRSLRKIRAGSLGSEFQIQTEIRQYDQLESDNQSAEIPFPEDFRHLLLSSRSYNVIRDRSRKEYRELFNVAADKIWNSYEVATKASFSQRVRRLHEGECRHGPGCHFEADREIEREPV